MSQEIVQEAPFVPETKSEEVSLYQQISDLPQQINTLLDEEQKFVNNLPQCLTNLKKNHILNHATLNERLVGLCISSLIVASITAKGIEKFLNYTKVQPKLTRVVRNAFVSYVGLGIFVTPEVFNPYLIYGYKGE
ncbi:hypothetical protein pb186bvf_001150 [Paramecium bursaria]